VNKMINAKPFLLLSVTSLLLLAGLSLSLQAQDPPKGYHPNPNATPLPTPTPIAAPDYQPMWAVNGKIRWKKEYGVVPVSANLQDSINNRCISFYVAALDPRTNQPLRGNHSQMWKADDEGDYYVCRYALQLPTNQQVRVIAQMGSDGLLPNPDPNPLFLTRPWIGGNSSQSRPPNGGMRAFTGSKYVTLDRRTPRASVDFELYYAVPRSDGPR
jgi:hypothetical protein